MVKSRFLMFKNQQGVAHILILIAILGLLGFLLVANLGGFKSKLFSTLFPKPISRASSLDGEEFVGPFPSWANVKTQYGAVGDGVADDTAALQNALNDVGTTGKSHVVYLPAGTYKITNTINLVSKLHVGVIGEDPATTTIKWAGSSGGIMTWFNGVAYSQFDRITWDGSTTALIAVDQSKADNNTCCFDTGNQYADDTFKDAGYGIRGGQYGYGFAETSILRSHFLNNSKAGIFTRNFNALDTWVWYSTFENCGVGIGNIDAVGNSGAGDFKVSNSIFKNNTVSDTSIGNTGIFAIRNSYSKGSRRFFAGGGIGSASAPTTFQNNVILDPTENNPIATYNPGGYILLDNIFRSNAGQYSPVVTVREAYTSAPTADVISLGNTFSLYSPYQVQGDIVESDDKIVDRATINPTEPTLPSTPPNYHRQIFEVPSGANAATIQQTIDQAALKNGQHSVVHIPGGNYSINQTITIPAKTDIQIIGDAGATGLGWNGGTGAGPVLHLLGPSYATLSNIYVSGAGQAEAIVVEDADQLGGRIYSEQVNTSRSKDTPSGIAGFLVDGLDHSLVEMHDFQHGTEKVGVKVVGGPLSQNDQPHEGKVNIFAGASSANDLSYDVSNGGKLLVEDMYYETGSGPGFTKLNGKGTFTLNGAKAHTLGNDAANPGIDINNFDGKAAFITTTPVNFLVQGDGTKTKALGLALSFISGATVQYSDTSPNAQAALLNSRLSDTGGGSIPLPDQVKNIPIDPSPTSTPTPTPTPTPDPNPQTNGLVGYWKMDESSWPNDCAKTSVGGISGYWALLDSSGHGNNGRSCPAGTGPTGGTLGKFGNGGNFDGVDDYVEVADNPSLRLQAQTISSWVKWTGNGDSWQNMIYKGNNYIISPRFSTNEWQYVTYNNSNQRVCDVESGVTINDRQWHLLTATFDGSTKRVYTDGKLVGSISCPITLYNDSSPVIIGSNAGLSTVSHQLDDVRIYNRALSDSEIANIFISPPPASLPPPPPPSQPYSPYAGFIKDMLSHVRGEKPQPVTPLADGVTDLRMYRIYTELGTVGVHLKSGPTTGSPLPTPTASPSVAPTPSPSLTPTPSPSPMSSPSPSDTTPPTVSITLPINGATLTRNSNITISANAADNTTVAKVLFHIDGGIKCTDTVLPYTCVTKISGKPGVTHTITAKAYDISGNTASSTIQIKAQ